MADIVRAINLGKQVQSGGQPLRILHDVTFGVAAGDSLAITGSSGSGKSTLLGLLAGLDVPSQGTVHLDGVDIFSFGEDERARLRGRMAGFVFQSFQLLPTLTALENVMLPLELRGAERVREQASEALRRVGLCGRMGHLPKHLSGGEQQRVAIARAFVVQPRILFADEPTGNLDAATGAKIIELMLELNREQGATLVLVTHDPVLAQCCNRKLHLADGSAMSV